MAKVNTHGLKMIGLKKVSSSTKNYRYCSGMYNEIFYNVETGEVWAVFQYSLDHNSWTEYYDENIVKICDTDKHMTMQEIADCIYNRIKE